VGGASAPRVRPSIPPRTGGHKRRPEGRTTNARLVRLRSVFKKSYMAQRAGWLLIAFLGVLLNGLPRCSRAPCAVGATGMDGG